VNNGSSQLDVGAGFGFLDELEQDAATQVVAALQRGDELAFNPDVPWFDKLTTNGNFPLTTSGNLFPHHEWKSFLSPLDS